MSASAPPPTSALTPDAEWAFTQYLDGNWVDIGSLILAMAIIWWRRRTIPKAERCAFFTRETAKELVSALTVFPLLLLTISSIFTKITPHLLSGSRITLTIAGGYALFSMLEDLLQPKAQNGQQLAAATEIKLPHDGSPTQAANDPQAINSAEGAPLPPPMAPAVIPKKQPSLPGMKKSMPKVSSKDQASLAKTAPQEAPRKRGRPRKNQSPQN